MKKNNEFDHTYREWIKSEKQQSDEILQPSSFSFRLKPSVLSLKSSAFSLKSLVLNPSSLVLKLAAAILIPLAIFTTLILTNRINWFDRKPHYTQAEIEKYYNSTVKVLALCAGSISQEMGKLQDLKQIPQSLDQLKVLTHVRAQRAAPGK